MEFKKEEIGLLWNVLTIAEKPGMDGKPQQKLFPYSDLKDVSDILKQIKTNALDGETFKDGELDLDTDKKKLLKDLILGPDKKREWAGLMMETIESTVAKLA